MWGFRWFSIHKSRDLRWFRAVIVLLPQHVLWRNPGNVPRGTWCESGELLEGEPAGGGSGEGDTLGVGGLFGGEGDEPAVGGDAGLGVGEGLLGVVDGAEGDGVEAPGGGQGVDAGCPDFCVLRGKGEGSDGFPEERGLLALGFG